NVELSFATGRSTKEHRNSLSHSNSKNAWEQNARRSRAGKYKDGRAARCPNTRDFFHDRRKPMHRVAATRDRARRKRIHQDGIGGGERAGLEREQTPTGPARD